MEPTESRASRVAWNLISLGLVLAVPVCGIYLVTRGHGTAYVAQCMNQLKSIFNSASERAKLSDTGYFPFHESGSIATFQVLLENDQDGHLQPRIFLCPEAIGLPAEVDDRGVCRLSEETCSYEFLPLPVPVEGPARVLIYDKAPYHSDHRNVCFSDGSLRLLPEAEFQAELAKTLASLPGRDAAIPRTKAAPAEGASSRDLDTEAKSSGDFDKKDPKSMREWVEGGSKGSN